MFPKEYKEIHSLKQALKLHHFTLSNTIKDVQLLASSTKSNLRRSVRKLNLRKKYLDDDKKELKPSTDLKIWKYEIKSQIADLTVSLEKCDAIIVVLKDLQTQCVRTSDNLKAVLLKVKKDLKARMEAKKL